MTKLHFLSLSATNCRVYHPCKILSEIINQHTALCSCNLYRTKLFVCTYRRSILCHDLWMNLYLFEACFFPGNFLQIHGGIIHFPVVKLCLFIISFFRYFPLFICPDCLSRSIGIQNPQLSKQRLSLCIHSVPSFIGERANCPATADHSKQLVSIIQHICHIISLILQLIPVGRKSRCKIILSDFLSI